MQPLGHVQMTLSGFVFNNFTEPSLVEVVLTLALSVISVKFTFVLDIVELLKLHIIIFSFYLTGSYTLTGGLFVFNRFFT